jgi:CHAT domain-containing protein
VGLLGLACLLCCALSDGALDDWTARLRENPGDTRAWESLAHFEEPGEALQAVRVLLREHPDASCGWHVLWHLADRVGDYSLATEAKRHALESLAKGGALESAERREEALSQEAYRLGLVHAERQALLRWRAFRERRGQSTTTADERLERIDLEVRQRAHPDPEALRAAAETARERGDWRTEHRLLVDRAYHCWATGQFREGYELYQRVLAIHGPHRREQKANDQNGMARMALELALTSTGEPRAELLQEALAHVELALVEHGEHQVGGPVDLVRDHCVLAHALDALGELEAARAHYEKELALVLELRRSTAIEGDEALRIFHSAEDHIFQDYALFQARAGAGGKGDVPLALRTSELGRVGGLKELYRLRGRASPSWVDQELPLSALQQRTGAAKVAVIVYFVGSHEAAAACITEGAIRCQPLAAPRELDRAAEALARAVADLTIDDVKLESAGRRAFELFLEPLVDALSGVERLVFVGAGRWGKLPFGALVLPPEQEREPLESRYLAARFQTAFAPTLGALVAEPGPETEGPALSFGFAGPGSFDPALRAHFELESLAPLSRAEAEARAVAKILGARALVGEAASEDALRELAPTAPLVHFAGHALIDDEDGTKSALVLAPRAAGSDGLLTLGETLELRLAARLVILSACRTARGDSYSGEGVGGIARCLLAAGARDLVLALAPVDDAKAPLFMERFAHALAAKKHPAAALALAQRALLAKKSHAHPAFWATWVLYGQGDLLR